MLLPESVTVVNQIVNFEIPAILILHLSTTTGFFYVYPLTRLYPSKKYKFSDNLPDDFFSTIKSVNEQLSADVLTGWDRIESSVIRNIPQGLVLCYKEYKFYLPFVYDSKFPQSFCKLSLNFRHKSDLIEFESDKLVSIKLMQLISYLNRNKISWTCEVDVEKFETFYKQFVSSLIFDKDIRVIYVKDDEMKKKLEYLKKNDYKGSVDNKILLSEKQINEFSVYRTRELEKDTRSKINTFLIIDKEHQCLTIDSNVYIVKKHKTEEDAKLWLDKSRLRSLLKTRFLKNDQKAYPNVKYQFYISTYDKISDYLAELLEDIDGYKISLIRYQKTIYSIIPIFIRYRRRSINDNSSKNFVGIINNKDSYWTLENKLYIDSKKIKFPFRIEISSVVFGNDFVATLSTDGIVWLIRNNIPTKIEVEAFIFKISVAGDRLFLLSDTGDLFLVENGVTKIDDSVDNIWTVNNSILYEKQDQIWDTKQSIVNIPKKKWKTLLSDYGLTYNGDVIDLKTKRTIKKKIFQITENNGILFGISKNGYFTLKKDGKIIETNTLVGQIVNSDLLLKIPKKNEK
jgi:hypothetical protein